MLMNTGAVRQLIEKLPKHRWKPQRDYNSFSGETWCIPGVVRFLDTMLVRLECEQDRSLAEYLAEVCPAAMADLLDHHDAALSLVAKLQQENDELRTALAEAQEDITSLSGLVGSS